MNQLELKSQLQMGDTTITPQLLSGLYAAEDHRWRWTAQQFSVLFPGLVTNQPRTLTLHLYVPEGQIDSLGTLTLQAEVNGARLREESYREPGMHTYTRTIPSQALQSNLIPVTFYLDKAVPPHWGEPRQLGVVVNDVSLQGSYE